MIYLYIYAFTIEWSVRTKQHLPGVHTKRHPPCVVNLHQHGSTVTVTLTTECRAALAESFSSFQKSFQEHFSEACLEFKK